MGFTDLSIAGSDRAADMAYDIGNILADRLSKELEEETNEYNTDGFTNTAMFFEEVICKSGSVFMSNDNLQDIADKIIEYLEAIIKKIQDDKDSYSDPDRFIRRYKQMNKCIKKWLNESRG